MRWENTPAEKETISLLYEFNKIVNAANVCREFAKIKKDYIDWLDNTAKLSGNRLRLVLFNTIIGKVFVYYILPQFKYHCAHSEELTNRAYKIYEQINELDIADNPSNVQEAVDYAVDLIKLYADVVPEPTKTCEISSMLIMLVKSIEQIEELNSVNLKADLITDMIKTFARLDRVAIDLQIVYVLDNLSRQNLNLYSKETVLKLLCDFYTRLSTDTDDVDASINYLKMAESIDNEIRIGAKCTRLHRLATLNYNQNNFQEALKYAEEKLHLEEAYHIYKMLSYEEVGFINKNLGNYDKSLEYYEKAFQLISDEQDEKRLIERLDRLKIYVDLDADNIMNSWREKYRTVGN